MSARLRATIPEHAALETQAHVVSLKELVVRRARVGLVFLFVAVGLVLLVACANVAGLLLTRVWSRERELSIRSALGAGGRRVVRLILTESLVLATLGGVVAAVLSVAGVRAVRLLAHDMMGQSLLPRGGSLVLDGRALLFAATASCLAAVLAGVLPAIRAATRMPGRLLTGSNFMGASRSSARMRDSLIVLEVAMSLVLLVGTGLMWRTFVALRDSNAGYSAEGLVGIPMFLPDWAVPSREARLGAYRTLEERLERLPDVTAVVAVAPLLPLEGMGVHLPYAPDSRTVDDWTTEMAHWVWVTPGFFRTTGASLVEGREFTWADLEGSRPVVIVDDRLAARAFGNGDALGRTIKYSPTSPAATIIGVVSHLQLEDLDRPGPDQIYWPMTSSSMFIRGLGQNEGHAIIRIVIRSSRSPGDIQQLVRREMSTIAPGVAVGNAVSLDELTGNALVTKRAMAVLMVVLAMLAHLIAAVGLYGVLAFAVKQRTKEIGIRIALGHSPFEVQRLVLRHGGLLLGIATLLGLTLAAGSGRLVRSLLYGVDPVDPATYVAVTIVVAATGVLACWLPARRATRIDPMQALRTD